MKKRVIWKMFLLTIVTIGIYRLYWFIKTRREMMNVNPSVKIMSPLFLFLPVILIVVSIVLFAVSAVQSVANRPICQDLQYRPTYTTDGAHYDTETLQPKAECDSEPPMWGIGILYLSIFLFYPLMVIWLWGYSKGVDTITGSHTSFAVALLILLLVPDGIDILIIQEAFNKLGEPKVQAPLSQGAPKPVA